MRKRIGECYRMAKIGCNDRTDTESPLLGVPGTYSGASDSRRNSLCSQTPGMSDEKRRSLVPSAGDVSSAVSSFELSSGELDDSGFDSNHKGRKIDGNGSRQPSSTADSMLATLMDELNLSPARHGQKPGNVEHAVHI
jgi:hypothetical protein